MGLRSPPRARTPPSFRGRRAALPVRVRPILLGLLVLVPLRVAAEDPELPRLFQRGDDRLVVTALPVQVLDREEVDRQLDSGLTTAFVVRVEPENGEQPRPQTVQVRYDLWEERYRVVGPGMDPDAEPGLLLTRSELRSWWEGLELVFEPVAASVGRSRRARLRLDVIPFSRSEQLEAQRWFADSVRRAGRSRLSEPIGDAPSTLERALEVMIATSIRRRSLVRWDWTAPIERGKGQ